MIYLVYNFYKQQKGYHYDLRNEELEIISLNLTDAEYEIGDFLLIEKENKKQKITKVNQPDNFLDYYYQGNRTSEELKTELSKYINKVKNPKYQILLEELVLNNEEFFIFPAAKSIHHAFIGGLCEHTLSMLGLAEGFIKHYDLNQDLLYTGIILHDMGKTIELTNYGLTYSVAGNLIGHICIAHELIVKKCVELGIDDDVDLLVLKHLILSHHGRLDYGSPKEPMLKEALVLNVIDDTDAKINIIDQAFSQTKHNSLTTPLMGFDRRRFFNYIEEEENE